MSTGHNRSAIKEIKREMRRNLLTGTLTGLVAAVMIPATSLWAAPVAEPPSTQYLNQISEQALQIQTQADRLEGYLRSGAHDAGSASRYTTDMAGSTQKLATLLDAFVSQPGTTNQTRQQVDRMKVSVAELGAFVGNAYQGLDTRAMALHLDNILANISNIVDRGNALRAAVHTLASAN